MSPTGTLKHFTLSYVVIRGRAIASGRGHAPSGPWSWSWSVVPEAGSDPVERSVSAAASRAGRVPASGCIVGTHAAEPSSPALRVALRVGADRVWTAPHAGAGSRLVSHTIRPEQRGKEDTMNRWTGTGHLTRDPKFLETENGTAICTLRLAVKRAGKQGHDGYFDVKCFDAQASACAQYLKAGRDVAVDGRLLFDEFQTQDGSYASRIYIVAERVEFLASRKPSTDQASDEPSPDQPATDGAAREAHPAPCPPPRPRGAALPAAPPTSPGELLDPPFPQPPRNRHQLPR